MVASLIHSALPPLLFNFFLLDCSADVSNKLNRIQPPNYTLKRNPIIIPSSEPTLALVSLDPRPTVTVYQQSHSEYGNQIISFMRTLPKEDFWKVQYKYYCRYKISQIISWSFGSYILGVLFIPSSIIKRPGPFRPDYELRRILRSPVQY